MSEKTAQLLTEDEIARRLASLSPAQRALLESRLKEKGESLTLLQRSLVTAPSIRPAQLRDAVPLSFAQEPMWFLDQLEPGNPAYIMGNAFRLRGPLHVDALGRSLKEIVRRHESLRTNFAMVDGQPVQVISPALDLALPLTDLEGLPVAEQEAQVRQLAHAEAGRPFDLEGEPLVRARLLRLGEEDHVLSLCLHHLISDGWSMGVLFRELSALYRAFSRGESSPLPELPIQYADYALWHRQWLQERVLDSQLSYWKQQLSSTPPNLELPTDRLRPAVQTYRGAKRFLTLPKDLYQALKALGQRERSTLYMVLLAAFRTLLYRYTGQEDIAVGSPIAGRNRPEVEGLIGLFLNMLVLRTDLSGNPTFRELLARVREVTLAAYAHQDVPFERLVAALQPPRDPSRSPLFQVMLEVSPLQALELDGLSVSKLDLDRGTAQLDLSLQLREGTERVRGHFEYNTDLFDASTIDRLADHFQMLLEGIARDPEQRILELPLLSPPEKHQILVEWNDTSKDYPHHACIHQLLEAQAERIPDATAVSFEGAELSYRAFNHRANQLAHHLQRLGVGPEVLVGVYMERSLEMVLALYGILKAGGAYVPLDPAFPADRIAFMITDAELSVVLTQGRIINDLPPHQAQVVTVDTSWDDISAESQADVENGVTSGNLAYVMYTSGSTGKPKGVMLRHRNVVNFFVGMDECLPHDPPGVWLAVTSLSFDISVLELLWTLSHGFKVVIYAGEGQSRDVRERSSVPALIERHQVTHFQCTPSMASMLLLDDESRTALSTVPTWLLGGEAFPVALAAELNEMMSGDIINMYGPTETTVWSSTYRVGQSKRTIPIGRPIANTQLYILDSKMQPVPVGVTGELFIGGDGVARGYVNRPELTAERFVNDPFLGEPDARLYRTGDLARYRPDGNIEFLGRIDYQVKVRGHRIELGEIESVLGQHPAVREAVVTVREDVPGDKRLVAYVVPNHQLPLAIGELRGLLKDKLPDYMVPAAFVELEALPLTPNNKVDRRNLPPPPGERQAEDLYIAPQNELERVIAGIWQDLLQVDRVGVADNFFDLGGHSLLATLVVARVRKALRVDLPLRTLFDTPTVAGLAESVETLRWLAGLPPIRSRSDGRMLEEANL
jgi:amino acid adenylation domain-containing protein